MNLSSRVPEPNKRDIPQRIDLDNSLLVYQPSMLQNAPQKCGAWNHGSSAAQYLGCELDNVVAVFIERLSMG